MRGSATCARAMAVAMAILFSGPAILAGKKIPVVATFTIIGELVRNVGGDRVSVTTLVGPGGDAHVFQPSPADAAAIKRAKAVFENGLGFERWLERLIESSGYVGQRFSASKKVKPLYRRDEHDDGYRHDGHRHHDNVGGADPHAWQSLANGILYVQAIQEGLCEVDVEGCPAYKANAAAYIAKLQALDAEISERFDTIPESKRKLVTSHDAFAYFADRYGLEIHAPEGITTDSEASAQDVASLIRKIRKHDIVALFVENVSDPRLLQQIARETDLTPSGRLYSDALSAPGGPAASYAEMMRHNAFAVADALDGGS